MSKLVDKERLAKLAQALDSRAKAAVAAEKERALAAEQAVEAKADANAAAIATINNTENGLLAQAKDYADTVANAEKDRAEEQEGLLADRIETLEGIVGSEAEGAFGAVKQDVADNKAAIAKLNGGVEEEGSVAKAVADAVKVEKDRAEGVEAGFETRIAANEKFVAAQPAKDEKQDQRLALLEEMMGLGGETGDKTAIQELQESITNLKTELQAEIDTDVKVEADRAVAKENELDAAIKANAAEMTKQKDADQEGTLAHKIAANATAIAQEAADRATAVSGEATARENADKALADRLDVIEGEGDGSVKKALADAKKYADDAIANVNTAAETLAGRVQANETKLAGLKKDTVQAAIDQAEKDAKAHAEQKIADLVDSAPDAMNTLNELAKAINDNKDVYDAYIEEHATAMASMKTELQAEIDGDVKVVTDELTKQKDAEQEGTLANQIKVEKARAEGQEAAIRQEMATEATRVNKKIADDIAAADATLKTALQKEIDDDVKAEKERAEGKEAELLAAINKEVQDRTTAVSGVQGEVDALETVVKDMKDATKDGSLAKQIADEVTRAKDEEADIRSDFAAADEALHATIKGEMAQVVASLNVKIVDNKLQIGLGQGVDFVTLNQFDLDMATDADIEAIIAGLDAPAAE